MLAAPTYPLALASGLGLAGPSACYQELLVGRWGSPGPHSPCSLFQLSPWVPTWAPVGTKPGAGRSALPPLGQARAEGLAVLLLLRGGGQGGAWRLGWGLCPLGSPPRSLLRKAAPELQKPAPRPPRLPLLPPSSRPTRLLLQPPTSFSSFLWQPGNAPQTASLPRIPGDARPLQGARINTGGVHTSPSQMPVDTQAHVTALDWWGGEGIPGSRLFLLFPLKTPPPPPDFLSDAANCASLRPLKSDCTAVL